MRARPTIAAVLTASVLLLSAACGSKDDNSEESTGSPAVTASAEAEPSEDPSESASPEPSESASPEPSESESSDEAAIDSPDFGEVQTSADGKTVSLALELVGGKPKERPPVIVKVEKGQTVSLTFVSDEKHEIHVHTYDVLIKVGPDKLTTREFEADKTGSFEVEVEGTKFKLFDLQVK